MRMRKKKHGAERIAACAELLIETPIERIPDPSAFFPGETCPLHLEIGCGKGDFAVGMAKKYPDVHWIAMEKFPDVACLALEKARATVQERTKDNLRFLIGDAKNLAEWFPPHSVDCIYLNFSDPWPKSGHRKRRLTYRGFLELYRTLLKPGGILKFKTDNRGLFDFTLQELATVGTETLYCTHDLHAAEDEVAHNNVETEYERNFSAKGFSICSVHVRFTDPAPIPYPELVRRTRSSRSFDPSVRLTREQLSAWVDCARLSPASMNLQVIKYRLVTEPEECANLLGLTRWAGKLKDVSLPPKGHEPAAYVVICTDAGITENAHTLQKDVGICAEALLLAATAAGHGGCMLGAFDAQQVAHLLSLPNGIVPELILALGKPDETICLTEVSESQDSVSEGDRTAYYREAGIHYVPKRSLEDVIL